MARLPEHYRTPFDAAPGRRIRRARRVVKCRVRRQACAAIGGRLVDLEQCGLRGCLARVPIPAVASLGIKSGDSMVHASHTASGVCSTGPRLGRAVAQCVVNDHNFIGAGVGLARGVVRTFPCRAADPVRASTHCGAVGAVANRFRQWPPDRGDRRRRPPPHAAVR
jgi:hypothetical protein